MKQQYIIVVLYLSSFFVVVRCFIQVTFSFLELFGQVVSYSTGMLNCHQNQSDKSHSVPNRWCNG